MHQFTKPFIFTLLLLLLISPILMAESDSIDVQYRNYLLGILETLVPESNYPGVEFPPDDLIIYSEEDKPLLVQEYLRENFKQDFATENNQDIPLISLSVTIMRRIVSEDWNISPADIPDQDDDSDYQYLETLIGLTGKSKQYLSSQYLFDFRRQGIEKTTPLKETIKTLQHFLADGKFGKEAKLKTLFSYTPHNPFFLYQNEWLDKKNTAFFPENHYAFKTAVFTSISDKNIAREIIEEYTDGDTRIKNHLTAFLDLDEHLRNAYKAHGDEEYRRAEDYYIKAWNTLNAIAAYTKRTIYYTNSTGEYAKIWRIQLRNLQEFLKSLDPERSLDHPTEMWLSYTKEMVYGLQGITVSEDKVIVDIQNGVYPATWPFKQELFTQLNNRYNNRKEIEIKTIEDLNKLEGVNTISCSSSTTIDNLNNALISLIPHIRFFLLPFCFGELYADMGNYSKSASFYVRCFKDYVLRGTIDTEPIEPGDADGDLPWNSLFNNDTFLSAGTTYPYLNTDCELPFIKIHIGDLYLKWADYLFQNNTQTESARARELYKAVMKMYSVKPVLFRELNPTEPEEEDTAVTLRDSLPETVKETDFVHDTIISDIINEKYSHPDSLKSNNDVVWMEDEEPFIKNEASHTIYKNSNSSLDLSINMASLPYLIDNYYPFIVDNKNPLIASQIGTAQINVAKIDSGLNYYGFVPSSVPYLRYEVLIEAAKSFSHLAKQAEDDYIGYMDKSEDAEADLIKARYAIKKADKLIQVETERIKKVTDEMKVTAIQVELVNDAIKAKEKEIEDADSYWGQLKSFFKGMGSFFKGIPKGVTKTIGADYQAAWSGSGAVGGAAGAGGFALFAIASYVTIDGMVSERNKLRDQLGKLKTQQLPMAEAAHKAKQHELAITQMQASIAGLEAEFTREIYNYLTVRTLNANTWNWMARAVKNVMRRYTELGAMTGWMAQQALNYEQNRSLDIIRFNYFNPLDQGLLSVESLQMDLAILEKEYLTGYQMKLPLKWQVSLARDFPLSFGRLITTGECQFMTLIDPLIKAFPGSHSHRIRTVSVEVVAPITEAKYNGILSNDGVSYIIEAGVAGKKAIVRPPDVFPISGFRWHTDMTLYGLPEKVLLPFEGSGIETYWNLELPPEANPGMLDSIADVIITFETYALFSSKSTETVMQEDNDKKSSLNLFSLKNIEPAIYEEFVDGSLDVIRFTLPETSFPPFPEPEKELYTYEIENIFLLFAGKDLPEIEGKIWNGYATTPITFFTEDGLVFSNNIPPSDPTGMDITPSDLNVLAAGDPRINWAITIENNDNPDLTRESMTDIIFGIEYKKIPVSE